MTKVGADSNIDVVRTGYEHQRSEDNQGPYSVSRSFETIRSGEPMLNRETEPAG